ncbi:MAG: hypothetical protein FWB77_02580 [Treponema sp.]|nr:hypothetical protein [Treponema sp.]
MKKIVLVLTMIVAVTSIAFAQFELNAGLYGGIGTAGSAGLGVQSGYNFSFSDGKLKLAVLADLGFGYRYGDKELEDYYKSKNWKDTVDANDNMFDYYFGLTCEFYFLSFMGVGLGGGLTKCICGYAALRPYLRATVPFVLGFVKLGVGFDYLILNQKHINAGVPPGYRVNIFANIRIMDFFK